MNLPVPNLDDRRFQDLVDEAKSKIPQLCPAWTNHNVADPGVALIELFAWMTEMSIFRLNQVPDAFYTRMLNLLGYTPFEKQAASTDLTFWLTSDSLQQRVVIDAGVEVATVGLEGEPRVFATMEPLVMSEPTFVAALTHEADTPDDDVRDAWTDLKQDPNGAMKCFGSAVPPVPGAAFYLGFEESLAKRAIRLDIVADTEAAGTAPDEPPIAWEVWDGSEWKPCEAPKHDRFGHPADGTGGINRSGSILLLMPDQHASRALGQSGEPRYWLRARLEPSAHQYDNSPAITDVTVSTVGGRVRAEHSRPIGTETLGISVGKPGQAFRLANPPLLPPDPAQRRENERVRVIPPEHAPPEEREREWTEVADFVGADENSHIYVIDTATGTVHFGPSIRQPNGKRVQHGAIPPRGATIQIGGYRTGGGAVGNVGARTLNGLRSSLSFVAAVTNLHAATGGVDAESVEEAKQRGPQAVRTGQRAVTAEDFERLARDADRDVKRVVCVPPSQPGDPVQVAIVPDIADPEREHPLGDYVLPGPLAATVRSFLDERRLLGEVVEVRPFHFQGVSVATRVAASQAAGAVQTDTDGSLHRQLIAERVDAAISRFINPLTGGVDGRGWPLDTDLTAAELRQVIDSVEGVDFVHGVVLFDYDLRARQRQPDAAGKDLIRLRPHTLFLPAQHEVVAE